MAKRKALETLIPKKEWRGYIGVNAVTGEPDVQSVYDSKDAIDPHAEVPIYLTFSAAKKRYKHTMAVRVVFEAYQS